MKKITWNQLHKTIFDSLGFTLTVKINAIPLNKNEAFHSQITLDLKVTQNNDPADTVKPKSEVMYSLKSESDAVLDIIQMISKFSPPLLRKSKINKELDIIKQLALYGQNFNESITEIKKLLDTYFPKAVHFMRSVEKMEEVQRQALAITQEQKNNTSLSGILGFLKQKENENTGVVCVVNTPYVLQRNQKVLFGHVIIDQLFNLLEMKELYFITYQKTPQYKGMVDTLESVKVSHINIEYLDLDTLGTFQSYNHMGSIYRSEVKNSLELRVYLENGKRMTLYSDALRVSKSKDNESELIISDIYFSGLRKNEECFLSKEERKASLVAKIDRLQSILNKYDNMQ